MIELVLVYCLSKAPDRCLERRQVLEDQGSSAVCMYSAQFRAKEFLDSHPAYQFQGWRCEVDVPRQAPA